MASNFLGFFFEKRAENPMPPLPPPADNAPIYDPYREQVANRETGDMSRAVLAGGGLGLGAGLSGAAIRALSMRMAQPYDTKAPMGADPIPIPTKRRKKREKRGEETPSQKTWRLVNSRSWFGPALAASTIGGLGAGYLGGQALLSKNKEEDDELEDARKEYTAALRGARRPAKTASAVDSLFETWSSSDESEKRAFLEDAGALFEGAKNLGQAAARISPTRLWTTYAAATALPIAGLTYWSHRNAKKKSIARALKRRDEIRSLESPPELQLDTEEEDAR